ncbi:MAG: DNA repair protein RecO [Gammaproteobacteria bacterium]
MKIPLHPCFILHQRSYRETSLLLEVFSSEHGRVGIIAKGAKRKRAVPQGVLQPYRRLLIACSGKGELFTLTDVEADSSSVLLQSQQVMAGFYLNELVLRLLHRHESHPDLFAAYENALVRLGAGDPEQSVLRIFEKRLLQSLGYGLVLDHEVQSGQTIDADRDYYYQYDLGPLSSVPSTNNHVKISGRTLQAIQKECLEDVASLREAKYLMRRVLRSHLGDKPLASRELYQAYMANRTYK